MSHDNHTTKQEAPAEQGEEPGEIKSNATTINKSGNKGGNPGREEIRQRDKQLSTPAEEIKEREETKENEDAEEELTAEKIVIKRRKARKQTRDEPDHAYRAFEHFYMQGSQRSIKDTLEWVNRKLKKPVSSKAVYDWSSAFNWADRIRRREQVIKRKIEEKIINTDVERKIRLLGVARDVQEEGLDVMMRKSGNAQFKDGVAAVKAGTDIEIRITEKHKKTGGTEEILDGFREIIEQAAKQRQESDRESPVEGYPGTKEKEEEKSEGEKKRTEQETMEREAAGTDPVTIEILNEQGKKERKKEIEKMMSV